MIVWFVMIPLLLGVALYTFRAGQMFWQDDAIRGAFGTWVLALASVVVPTWFLWRR